MWESSSSIQCCISTKSSHLLFWRTELDSGHSEYHSLCWISVGLHYTVSCSAGLWLYTSGTKTAGNHSLFIPKPVQSPPIPTKHAEYNLHPIRIGSEALAGSGLDDSCTPACFQTGSVSLKPDTVSQNQVRSRLVLHNMIQAIGGRMQPSLKVENL